MINSETLSSLKTILREYLIHERKPVDRIGLCRGLERTGAYAKKCGANERATPLPAHDFDVWQFVIKEMVSEGTLLSDGVKVSVNRDLVGEPANDATQRRLF